MSGSFRPISRDSRSSINFLSAGTDDRRSVSNFRTFFFSMTFSFPNSSESWSELSYFLSFLVLSISFARLMLSPIELLADTAR